VQTQILGLIYTSEWLLLIALQQLLIASLE